MGSNRHIASAALIARLERSLEAEAASLARGYAERRGEAPNTDALADGHLLGAGTTARFLRRLGAQAAKEVKRSKRSRLGRPTFLVRANVRDRIARPGTSTEVLLPDHGSPVGLFDQTDEPPSASIAFTTAHAPAIAMNLALSEAFVENRKVALVVGDGPSVDLIERALAPAIEGGFVSVCAGNVDDAIQKGREAGATRVTAIAPRAALSALEAVTGETVAGFVTDVPSTFAIPPFLYDRRELDRRARFAVAELLAPPCATVGVEIVTARSWLQRAVFPDFLRKAVRDAGAASSIDVVHASGGGSDPKPTEPAGEGDARIALVEVDNQNDDAASFFERASQHLRGEDDRWLVTAFAHSMELERRAFEDDLDAFFASIGATTLGVNARASLLYLDGAVPVGRRGLSVQNALGLRGVDRTLVEAPLHWAACEARSWAAARARYDTAPSLGRAAALGVRALFF